ncbi:MAG: LysR family transcriptional regulator [Tistlia sp.]|uniref:LysR family transcriptional regulator n=1 Tax=Tistlia sp. TaxID=3057121 RepID=UPI0034A11571
MPDTRQDRLAWDLDWNLLRTFMVIVEEQGITRAADRLGLKQPTVSNALRRMEERLQRRLIERKPNAFQVTAVGRLLYEECVEVFGTVSRLPILLREVQEEITGRVAIALTSHVISPLLDGALAEFHAAHPRATFTLGVTTSEQVVKAVLQKQASFGLCLVRERDPRLEYEQIYREFFGFFCGPKHRLFRRGGLTLEDLRGETSVSFQTDQPADALRPVALLRARAGLDSAIVGISSSLEEVRRMIVAGLGIGPLPLHVAQDDVAAGRLWRLPPYEEPPQIDIFLVWNPAAKLNRAEAGLLELLRKRIAATPLTQRTYAAG